MRLRTLGAVCATCAASAPASAVAADPAPTAMPVAPPLAVAAAPVPAAPLPGAPVPGPAVPAAVASRRPSPVVRLLVERNIALKQRHLKLLGDRLTRDERRHRRTIMQTFGAPRMRVKNLRLGHDIRALRERITNRFGGAPDVPIPDHLAAIARCESGGDPRAVSASGQYRGKYQFSIQTWRSVGGTGDPAQASETEQDRRAAILYRRYGPGQWPVCGR